MSTYTVSTDFSAKDGLVTGNPAKIVKGAELTTEFNNIATAISSKADSTLGLFGNGAVGAPSIAFTNSPTTGFFRGGVDIIALATAGVQRLQVGATGNVTIASPVTGGLTALIQNTSAVDGDTARLAITADTIGFALFVANNAQSTAIVTGGPTGPQGVLRGLGNVPLVLGTNNTERVRITGAGQMTVFEPLNGINATKNAATYDTGNFTATLTGCTTAPTCTVNWTRIGNTVVMEIGANFATSNSTALTLTGVPAALNATRSTSSPTQIINNGTNEIQSAVVQTNIITFQRAGSASGFTNTGTKGVANTTLVYNLT